GVDKGLVDRGAGLAERLGHRLELVPVDDERQVVGVGERRGVGGEDLEAAAGAVAEEGELARALPGAVPAEDPLVEADRLLILLAGRAQADMLQAMDAAHGSP